MVERPEIQAPAIRILEALEAECDKGIYGPRAVTAHDVARRADRSVATVTKWMSRMSIERELVDASWRSGRKGFWKISDKGREVLAALRPPSSELQPSTEEVAAGESAASREERR